MTALRLVALDLSLRSTGIAWNVDHRSTPKTGTRTVWAETLTEDRRVREIIQWVAAACLMKPHLVLIESIYIGAGMGGTPLRLAELHGVVKYFLRAKGLPFKYISPEHIKMYATGSGAADKKAVMEAVIATYGRAVHIGDNNAADAYALMALGLHAYGVPLVDVANPKRFRAIDAAAPWPRLQLEVPDLAGAP